MFRFKKEKKKQKKKEKKSKIEIAKFYVENLLPEADLNMTRIQSDDVSETAEIF